MDLSTIYSAAWEAPFAYSLPVPLFAVMCATYAVLAPRCSTEKKRAYLLSTFSSAIMSTLSIPFVIHYFTYGLKATFEAGAERGGWLRWLGEVGTIFFGVYLFADLFVGYFCYKSQVGLLTGWIHHTVYIFLMIYCLNSPQTPVFMIGCIMEVPTFDLAISNLFPTLRSDPRFLINFFLLRILFNLTYLIHCAWDRAATAGSWVPPIMLALSLVLHISWFRGGLTGYLKRQRAAKKAAAILTSPSTLAVPAVDGSGKVLVGEKDGPPTPEDSPLVTPYTPGTTPMTLRDSYLFPKGIPSLSDLTSALPPLQLPPLQLPQLPRDLPKDMGQFKDAVKLRWEESRERFGAMRGRGGMVGLGGLGLRRRAGNVAEATPAVAVAS